MAKVNKSVTIDEDIARAAEGQAKKERRSFSSLVEYLLDVYLNQQTKEDENKRGNTYKPLLGI
jgi:hypothetical protein